MKKIIFATGNQHKLEEIRAILPGFDIISAKEAGVSLDIEETGTTFKENAYIKAKAIWDITACICAILEDGTTLFCEGSMEGLIATQTSGSNGFGYDPILYLPEYQKTSAEISPEEKNKISHRGKALTAMKQKLGEIYENIDC